MYMKRQATIIVAIVFVLTVVTAFASSAQSFKFGDANCDGKINIKDATVIQRYAAMLLKLDDAQLKLADVNADGKVNVKDATMIQKLLAKLIPSFPADASTTEPQSSGDEAATDSVSSATVGNSEVTVATSSSELGSDPAESVANTTEKPSETQ